jgi:hypothetical protein
MSLIDHSGSHPNLDISPIRTLVITAEVKKKNYNSTQCRLSGKICVFCVGTIWRICLSSDCFYSESSVVQGLIRMEFLIFQCFVLTLTDDFCCL